MGAALELQGPTYPPRSPTTSGRGCAPRSYDCPREVRTGSREATELVAGRRLGFTHLFAHLCWQARTNQLRAVSKGLPGLFSLLLQRTCVRRQCRVRRVFPQQTQVASAMDRATPNSTQKRVSKARPLCVGPPAGRSCLRPGPAPWPPLHSQTPDHVVHGL